MNEDNESLFDLYRDEVKRLSTEYHTAGGVLYSCVLAVINFNSQDNREQTQRNHSMAPVNDVYTPTGEFTQIQSAGKNGMFQGLVHSVHGAVNTESDIMASELDDALAGRLSKALDTAKAPVGSSVKLDYTRASVAGLILFERHAIIRAQIASLLEGKILPMKPEMSSTERGIKETELLSFTSLSTADLYRNDQMQTVAKMLEAHVRALPNFTGTLRTAGEDGSILRRKYFRQLSAQTFAQILSAERVREPVVVKQYYPLTDDLLLALHWPPPERRIRKETWTWTGPIPVINDPAAVAAALAKEQALQKGKKKGKAPVKKPKKGQKVVEAPTTMSCTISTTTLTPAAHSIALIKRSAEPASMSWLSIHVNGSILGLRMETCSILVADLLAEQDHVEDLEVARSIKSAQSHDSADGAAAEEGALASPGGSEAAPSRPDTSAAKLSISNSVTSLGVSQDPPRGVFFCHTEDDIRFSACAGPSPQPVLKPDGFGTICLIATYPDTTTVTICSNGTTKIALPLPTTPTPGAQGSNKLKTTVFDAVVGAETDRFVGSGGAVMSNYSKLSTTFAGSDGAPVQFAKEIREADGSRLLIARPAYGGSNVVASLAASFGAATVTDAPSVALSRGGSVKADSRKVSRQSTWDSAVTAASNLSAVSTVSRQQSNLTTMQFGGFKKNSIGAFYQTVCNGAPQGWTCVRLGADGTVVFYMCPPDSSLLQSADAISHPTLHNIRTSLVDAETKATVHSFQDGRILSHFADGRVECKFGDGTIITTHAAGAMVCVSKTNLPTIEIDTEIDDVSRQHARGREVPINKGGERVRSRIALQDGTAVLVKYDTRLTTVTNGSIKVVRRDKTVMLLKDSGAVTYTPRAAWTAKAAAVFAAECADLPPLPVSPARNVSIAPGNSTAGANTQGRSRSPGTRNTTAAPTSPSSQSHHSHHSRHTLAQSLTSAGGASVSASVVTGGLNAGGSVTSNRRSVAGGSINPRGRKTSPVRGRTTQGGRSEGPSEPVEKEAEDASFTFDIVKFKCRIQDYEFNSFDIDLSSPDCLDPAVTLSGEVEGLKPPAVADKPMEPRVFVVSRAAEATELVSGTAVETMDTLARTCPDVAKLTAQVYLQPSDLGPATLNKYFIRRRLLGARGDGFSFQEVFGDRYWYPQTPPAAGLNAEHTNQLIINKANKKRSSSQPSTDIAQNVVPARYYDLYSVVEQSPLSAEGHVQLQSAIRKCDDFRAARLTSLDRFKVEEDRSPEELAEEEALAKRLKLAFKAAKVNAAKKKEAKAKLLAAATPTVPEEPSQVSGPGMLQRKHSAILEGDNEDGDEEDMREFLEDDETAELDPEEIEVRDTFDDFCVQAQHEGFTIDDSFTIARSSLQDAFIRLFNRFIPYDEIMQVMSHTEECDASYEELTLNEFRALYFGMKENLNSEEPKPSVISRLRRIDTSQSDGSADEGSIGDHTANTQVSSPTYWQSPLGQKVIRTLPPAAPPLDLRRIEWDQEGAIIKPASANQPDKYSEELYGDDVYPEEFPTEGSARMVSTAHPAVGSALQAARRSNSNRAVTAPE